MLILKWLVIKGAKMDSENGYFCQLLMKPLKAARIFQLSLDFISIGKKILQPGTMIFIVFIISGFDLLFEWLFPYPVQTFSESRTCYGPKYFFVHTAKESLCYVLFSSKLLQLNLAAIFKRHLS